MHPNTLRWLFLVKSIIVPIAAVAMMIWALKVTHGGGMCYVSISIIWLIQCSGPIFAQRAVLQGSARGWAFMSSLTSVIGNYATLSVNIGINYTSSTYLPHLN